MLTQLVDMSEADDDLCVRLVQLVSQVLSGGVGRWLGWICA